MRLYIDIETRNDRDLRKVGSWKYSRSPVGGINCIAVITGDKEHIYKYEDCLSANTEPMGRLKKLIDRPDVILVAHNAKFEADYLLNCFGWDIPANKWRCTQAKVAYYNLPQSLDKAAQALNLPLLKDMGNGRKAMLELCKCDSRGKHITPEEAQHLFEDLYPYCMIDNKVCKLIDEVLPNPPEHEQGVWEMDFNINRRGVPLDWFLIRNAVDLADKYHDKYDGEIRRITLGWSRSSREGAELVKWLASKGINVKNVTAETVESLLQRQDLQAEVRKVLELRQEQSGTAISKFRTMLLRMDDTDSRIRGEFWYYGAHTGRWTGTGVQVQNLVRGYDGMLCNALSEANTPFIEAVYDRPLLQLKGAVRGSIAASEGHKFLGVDLAQIEDRCGAWLSGQQDVVEIYRSGLDVYCETASRLLGKKVTKKDKDERMLGKVTRLSFLFGGGIGAIERNCGKYGFDPGNIAELVKPTEAEKLAANSGMTWYYEHDKGGLPEHAALALDTVKQRWRLDNQNTVRFWGQLFQAFMNGQGHCGSVTVSSTSSGTRVIVLPSNRLLFYRDVADSLDADGNQIITYNGRDGRRTLIKGKLFENVVQACDSDVARFYMLEAEKVAPIVHHSHDEYLLEVPEKTFAEAESRINQIHSTMFPTWAPGLPITYETWSGYRYEK